MGSEVDALWEDVEALGGRGLHNHSRKPGLPSALGGSNKALEQPILSRFCCSFGTSGGPLSVGVLVPGYTLVSSWCDESSILYPEAWLRPGGLGELVVLGTQELCSHRAPCSFHTKAGAAPVAVLGLVRVRVDRPWLLNEVVAACLPS